MTCKFVPHKEPKKETTLARLGRRAKAIERLASKHNKAVQVELDRLTRAITCQRELNALGAKARLNLQDLYEKVENLDVGGDEN